MKTWMKWVLVAGAVSTGCGGGCGNKVKVEDLDEELPGPICEKIFECCSDEEIEASQGLFFEFEDEASCVETYDGLVSLALISSIVAAEDHGRAEYDGQAAADCIDDIKNSSCEEAAQRNLSEVICEGMIKPLLSEGDTCKQDFECIEGSCYMADFDAEEGTCMVLPTAGEPCLEQQSDNDITFSVCAEGFACVDDTCIEPKEPGADCSSSAECQTNCDIDTNTCAERLDAGENCFGDDTCKSNNCGSEGVCVGSEGDGCGLL